MARDVEPKKLKYATSASKRKCTRTYKCLESDLEENTQSALSVLEGDFMTLKQHIIVVPGDFAGAQERL